MAEPRETQRQERQLPTPAACEGCWLPQPTSDPWQWQLEGRVKLSLEASVYEIDGLDATPRLVSRLHERGRRVICYVDVGTWERFRDDSDRFPRSVRGRPVEGFQDERWLDIRRLGLLRPIVEARLDACERKGFDAIEADNVDGYQNPTGFPLDFRDQLAYNAWVANAAHVRGMSIGLKNDLGQVGTLLPYFDFAVNEQCAQYHECDRLRPFVEAGKAVFQAEYRLPRSRFCPRAERLGFSAIGKRLSLGPFRLACAS